MSRAFALIALAALVLALTSMTPLAAQSVPGGHPTRVGSCDPRIDVTTLPPGGGALHEINTSGSFFMSRNIVLGAGQTGIAVGPNASSVVLDGNGFSIIGDPSLTSVGGLVFEPSPVQHASFRGSVTQASNANGDAFSISNVKSVTISGGALSLIGGSGMHFTDCGSVVVEGVSFSQCATGISSSSVSLLQVNGCVLIDNGTAVSACGHSSRFTDVVVQRGSNGIVWDDSCLNPASMEPFSLQCSHTDIEDVLQTGLAINRQSPGSRVVFLSSFFQVDHSGQDGISINVAGSLDLSVSNSSSSGNGGDGLKVTDNSPGDAFLVGHDFDTNRNGGHGVEIIASGEVVMSTTGGSSSHNGGDGQDVRANTKAAYSAQRSYYDSNAGNGLNITCAGTVEVNCSDSNFSDNNGRGLQVVGGSGGPGGGSGGSVLLESSILQRNSSDGCVLDFSASTTDGKAQVKFISCPSNGSTGMTFHNVSATLQSVECSSNGSHGLQAQLGDIKCDLVKCNSNGGDGFNLSDSSADLSSCKALHNGGDGIDCASTLVGSNDREQVFQTTCADNHGFGMRLNNNNDPSIVLCPISRNISGGLRIYSVCIPIAGKVTSCAFSSNGGVACDIQNAAGGEVSNCVVSGSATGIHVGDPSGGGCCTGVRVSDNTVSSCTTGIAVDVGGHHLVVRNMASSCTTNFAVGTGNMVGPVLTSADIGMSPNPNANYAP